MVRHGRVPSGAMEADRTTPKWETRQEVKLLLSWGSGQGFREYGSVGGTIGGNMPPRPWRGGATAKPSDESEPPPDSLQTPQGHGVLLELPTEDSTAGLACSRASSQASHSRRTFGKAFSAGELSADILLLKVPKALNYLFTGHSSLMRPLLAFLFHTFFPLPVSAWWAVVGNMLPAQASPTSHLGLCCRGSKDVSVSQRPVGDPDRQSRAVSMSHSASRGNWVRLHLPPATL